MTTIVGVQGDGFAVVCSDSRISSIDDSGLAYQVTTLGTGTSKVAQNGKYLLGAAGDVRAINILHHAFTPPAPTADLKGKKMRIQSSKVLEAQMRALGSLPQVLPFSEVYQALQTGVVDGTENPISNLYTQKMYEVQKHLAMTEHGYLGYAVIVNKKFWDGLPPDVREQLDKAMNESTAFANRIAKHQNDQDLEKVKKSGTPDKFAGIDA